MSTPIDPNLIVVPSALASVDKAMRLDRMINSRINRLCKYFEFTLRSDSLYEPLVKFETDTLQLLRTKLGVANNAIIMNSVYKAVLREWKTFPKTFEKHCERLFGNYEETKYDLKMRLKILEAKRRHLLSRGRDVSHLDKLVSDEKFIVDCQEGMLRRYEEGARHGRKSELLRRLMLDMEMRTNEGWFYVFNTLTIKDGEMDKVFPTNGGSSAWTDYIRYVDRFFGEAAFGSYREAARQKACGQDYHTYLAVVEKGSATRRLHIHVLHGFRTMPTSFQDPNYGTTMPYYREIEGMRNFWKHGFSSPVVVRFSNFDSYGRAGWRWPVKQVLRDGKPVYEAVQAKPIMSIVSYIGKYITKAYIDTEVGCIWRTRLSRRLGQEPIKKVLKIMPLKLRMELLRVPKLKLSLGLTRLPRYLLRRLLLKSVPRNILVQLFRRALQIRQTSLLGLWRSLIQGIPVYSPRNVGDFRIKNTVLMAVSKFFPEKSYSIAIAGACHV